MVALAGIAGAGESEVKWVEKELKSVGGNVEWGIQIQKEILHGREVRMMYGT